ncbi:MAG TPA: GxxExxY protein [Candidatus Bacteroides pullicola]|uniref:GxxExxY protein n=1 Tax=Candidatus Bacteroides pullicola TaxID=2838475 RepID=A0A9D2CKJ6_9BACE|nr:GxxExxY protein [Candidatus Bacteroides pullicola]
MTTDFVETDYLYKEDTDDIIAAFYEVYNTLGYGFLERVYQNALYLELLQRGFDCKAQYPIKVKFKGREVGEYYADILVNNCVIVELKSVDRLLRAHELQLINYLKATDIEVGLLLNFGESPQIRRKIFTNDHK